MAKDTTTGETTSIDFYTNAFQKLTKEGYGAVAAGVILIAAALGDIDVTLSDLVTQNEED